MESIPAAEVGNETPIELESEQCRRRLQKRKASIAGAATRFSIHRGSIAVINGEVDMRWVEQYLCIDLLFVLTI